MIINDNSERKETKTLVDNHSSVRIRDINEITLKPQEPRIDTKTDNLKYNNGYVHSEVNTLEKFKQMYATIRQKRKKLTLKFSFF